MSTEIDGAYHQKEITAAELQSVKDDIQEFKLVYDTYFERIFRFLYRRGGNENLAKELSSNTFLAAMENIEKYEYRGLPFSSWLYRIASNELNKHYRKGSQVQVFSVHENRIRNIIQEEFSSTDVDNHMELLSKYLSELKEEDLNVLELRYYEGLGFKEIAFVLQEKESAVKMRVYRSLQKLRQKFKGGGL